MEGDAYGATVEVANGMDALVTLYAMWAMCCCVLVGNAAVIFFIVWFGLIFYKTDVFSYKYICWNTILVIPEL
jgi:hypothetical protein